MGMEVFEILFSQDRRFEFACVSIQWLGWLLLCKPKVRRVSPSAIGMGRLTALFDGPGWALPHGRSITLHHKNSFASVFSLPPV